MKKQEGLEGHSVLVRECEAFLEGTLAEYLDEQGLVVPVWAWTNLLAHGGPEQITECVCAPSYPVHSDRDWSVARSILAFEIFDLMEAGSPLEELQQDVLIPLELELAAHPQSQPVDSPPVARHLGRDDSEPAGHLRPLTRQPAGTSVC